MAFNIFTVEQPFHGPYCKGLTWKWSQLFFHAATSFDVAVLQNTDFTQSFAAIFSRLVGIPIRDLYWSMKWNPFALLMMNS